MRIRMLVTRRGSPDGIHAVEYRQGEAYDLPLVLAESWLAKGYCEQDKMLAGPEETKDEAPALAKKRGGKRR